MKQRKAPFLAVLHLPGLWMYAVLLVVLLALLLIRTLPASNPAQAALAPALFGVSIVIDPGHGDWDPGMVGEASIEKEINLAVASALAEYCRAAGASVTMTRERDSSLGVSKQEDMRARVALAQAAQADIFISLHCNSYISSQSQHGAQVFYQKDNLQGQLLAETLQASLARQLQNTDRAALTHPGSYLLQHIDGAAVVCEMGFLSNPAEEALLGTAEYRWQMAWAIYLGLHEYLYAAAAAE